MRFLKDSAVVFIGLFCRAILTLAIDRQLAVSLSPEVYGEFKYSLTIIFILSVFSGLGLNSSLVRYISINRLNHLFLVRIFKVAILLVFCGCVASGLLFLFPTVQKWAGISNHSLFYLLLGTLFFLSVNSLCQGVFSGLKHPVPKTIINDILGSCLFFVIVYCHFKWQLTLNQLAVLYLGYMSVVFLANIFYLSAYARKYLTNNRDVDTELTAEIIHYTWPIFVTAIIVVLTSSVDKLVLGKFVSRFDLGVYFTAVTLTSILPLILTALLFLYFPIASSCFKSRKYRLMSIISAYTSKWAMLMAFVPFWIYFLHSEEVILLVFTEDYLKAVVVLKILAAAQFINASVGFTGQNLLALGDSQNQMKIRLLGLVFGLICGVYLARSFGIDGVAVSVLVTLLLTNLCQLIVLVKKHRFLMYKKSNVYALGVLIVFSMLDVSFHWSIRLDNLFLKVGFDVCLLLITLIFFRLLNRCDLRVLSLLSRK